MARIFNKLRSLFPRQYIKSNRWSVLFFAIVLFMLFVIGRNIIHAIQIGHDSSILRSEAKQYQKRITADSTLIESLKHDSELERYARENYYLQRPNEEIFIIEGGK